MIVERRVTSLECWKCAAPMLHIFRDFQKEHFSTALFHGTQLVLATHTPVERWS